MTSPFRCSAAAADQSMAGTAARDAGFLLVEHPGPWGNKALAESRLLDEATRVAVARGAAENGIRVQLIRRPGRATDGRDASSYRVFLAHPESGRLDVQDLRSLDELGGLDLDLAIRGSGWRPYDGPLLLVCTNGRRDVCCAERGRPVAQAVAAVRPEETWETTHLGGHRFAVAALTLPDGMSYGRVDADAGVAIIAAARRGEVVPTHLRGRTAYAPPVQAAEVALRQDLGIVRADALALLAETTTADTTTASFDVAGRLVEVTVVAEQLPPVRQSCADVAEKPSTGHRVVEIRARDGSGSGSR